MDYFGNDGGIFSIWVNGMICCDDLCYFMNSRIGKDIKSFLIKW